MALHSPKKTTATLRCHGKELTLFGGEIECMVSVEREDALWEVQEALAAMSPSLVVLDLHLPIGFGAKLLDLIHETCPGASVVTNVHSSAGHASLFSIESGLQGLVLKPLDERA